MIQPKCTFLEDAKTIVNNQTLHKWLTQHAKVNNLKYLLAHAEDGVIWGKFKDGELITAYSEFPQFAQLREFTLQQCRAFCENGEVMLWRTDDGWQARLIEKVDGEEPIIEPQILWGTKIKEEKENFTLLYDGQEGLEHAVPLPNIPDKFEKGKQPRKRPVHLVVYHYFKYNDDGLTYIYLSRIVDLIAV